MSKFKRLLSVILIACAVITCGFSQNVDAASVYGNSSSNINNGGLAASSGDYSFVRSSKIYKEGKEEDSYYIYRTYKNGTSKKQIVNNASSMPYINVVGSYIYYVGVYNSGKNLGVYRVKKDGTGQTRLMSNYGENPIVVKDNYLYYVKQSVNSKNQYVESLCRYNTSTKKTVSTLYTTTTRYITNMSLYGDYIYITAHGDNNSIVYKINTKTKSRTTLYKLESPNSTSYITELAYYKGNLYYTVYSENNDNSQLYKISTSGKNRQRVTKYFTSNINLYNNKVYYVNSNGSVCSMNLDGSSRTTIKKAGADEINYGINIANSRVYFENMIYDMNEIIQTGRLSSRVYRMTLSGKSLTKM